MHMVPSLAAPPLKKMLEAGLAVSCNTDDPAYLGARRRYRAELDAAAYST
jgi:adenosine deaminase